MRNNFDNDANSHKVKSYITESVFNLNEVNQENESYFEHQNDDDEQYNLNTYIRLNSNLISEINNLENALKTLTKDQSEVINYIKTNLDNQMLMFLSGEGGCGKTYLLSIINNFLTMNGLIVKKLATTGFAATLIEGQTVHGFFLY